ncbi:hypothetical protein K488DRAFT_85623 [Vararia minispora EC-137]|uniref:Uncharacterized protein n=1 Tax=Vararia minispora EC-137 TaxID=1314806 RepID=A0ACB8QM50_9AGAM|nr:hypothetical protein K488DRAFT_85623 [Vararia minispora EC-137]
MVKLLSFIALALGAVSLVSSAILPRQSVGTTPEQIVTGGYATYYYQFGGYGACGNINPDSALIVALESQRYTSSLCGRQVQITNLNNGAQVTATIADNCPGCGGNTNSLDLSVGSWVAIGRSEADGSQVPISWYLI